LYYLKRKWKLKTLQDIYWKILTKDMN